jgi:hypothetical protein
VLSEDEECPQADKHAHKKATTTSTLRRESHKRSRIY